MATHLSEMDRSEGVLNTLELFISKWSMSMSGEKILLNRKKKILSF